MNSLAHFLINYLILNQFMDARKNIVLIFISSVLIDLDHIPYILKNLKNVFKKGLNELCRTPLHELIGLALVSVVLLLLSFFINKEPLIIIWLCFFLHLVVDYMSGATRPFFPFSKFKMVSPLQKVSRLHRIVFEISVTSILLFLFFQ